ncbi:MAG: SDR family oxidoreductase [Oligoflexales bacterium]
MFNLERKVAVITGGAGLLGKKHAEALLSCGAKVVLVDIEEARLEAAVEEIGDKHNKNIYTHVVDITSELQVRDLKNWLVSDFKRFDILINNAAINPAVSNTGAIKNSSRLENFDLDSWDLEMRVGLTGAFLCSKYLGSMMAEWKSGSIINVSSDLGIIGPNQEIYKEEGLHDRDQSVKPVTYSVIKSGLIGLTRYLATYWARSNVRCNAICPGGVFNNQPEDFVNRLSKLIPLGRMASLDDYKGAIVFLSSDESSYMTGSTLIVDGGRTCW